MTVVLVHGVPETAAIWDDMIPHLGRSDVVKLSPPGFGAPVPNGFGCTPDDYRDWLADQLNALPGPIDLIGHDWGGIHTLRIAMERPELIRCWSSDVAGVFSPAYKWHDMAQGWQTPGVGEKSLEMLLATPVEQRSAGLKAAGMSGAAARAVAAGMNEDMARAILPLYRGAAQPYMGERGADLEKAQARPGLAIIATKDIYAGGPDLSRECAERTGAGIVTFEGLGHWWMCQEPELAANTLTEFLNRHSA